MDVLLDDIFKILEVPNEQRAELKKTLLEIISYKLGTELVQNLNDEQKKSMSEYLKTDSANKDDMVKWILENLDAHSDEINAKLQVAIETSLIEFFEQINIGKDPQKIQQIKQLLKSKHSAI